MSAVHSDDEYAALACHCTRSAPRPPFLVMIWITPPAAAAPPRGARASPPLLGDDLDPPARGVRPVEGRRRRSLDHLDPLDVRRVDEIHRARVLHRRIRDPPGRHRACLDSDPIY